MSWKDFEKKVERGPIPAVLAILFVLFVTIAITGGYTLLRDWALQRYYAPQIEGSAHNTSPQKQIAQ